MKRCCSLCGEEGTLTTLTCVKGVYYCNKHTPGDDSWYYKLKEAANDIMRVSNRKIIDK